MTEGRKLTINVILYTGLLWGPLLTAATGEGLFLAVGIVAFFSALLIPLASSAMGLKPGEGLDDPMDRKK
jgi:hypothetical protein